MQDHFFENIHGDIIEEMQSIHFVADLHYCHPKIVDICNRPVLKENHDEWIINEVINKWVKKKDTLFLLGDVSFAKREKSEVFLDKLHGKKFLILGNHDKNIDKSTRFLQVTQIKDFKFKRRNIFIHIVLCHYPISSWNRKAHGSWHLYGHVHGRFKEPGLAFDVGIDNQELRDITGGVYRPLNLLEIVKLMTGKEKFLKEEQFKADNGIY